MFEWTVDPLDVFPQGMDDYELNTFATLFELCTVYADKIQTAMRQNATWLDTCLPGREYLRAEAFYPDQWSVGIRGWYDLDLYRSECGEPQWDWGTRHETMTFAKSGVISIILPRGEVEGHAQATMLGSLADELWDAVRSLYAS